MADTMLQSTGPCLESAVADVLDQFQERDVLSGATFEEVSNYNRHFTRLCERDGGELPSQATAAAYLSKEFLEGPALDRILTYVVTPGSASLSQSSFYRAMHLINLTLRNAQQDLFDGDAVEAAPVLPRKSVSPSKRQHPTISQLLQSLGEDGASDSIKCNLQDQLDAEERLEWTVPANYGVDRLTLQENALWESLPKEAASSTSARSSEADDVPWASFDEHTPVTSPRGVTSAPATTEESVEGGAAVEAFSQDIWDAVLEQERHETMSKGKAELANGELLESEPSSARAKQLSGRASVPSSARNIFPCRVVKRGGAGELPTVPPLTTADRQCCLGFFARQGFGEYRPVMLEDVRRLFGPQSGSGFDLPTLDRVFALTSRGLPGLRAHGFALLVCLLHGVRLGARLPWELTEDKVRTLLDLKAHSPVKAASHIPRGSSFADDGHTKLQIGLVSASPAYRKPMDRPFITLMLRDSLGRLVELPQDTHPGLRDAATSAVSFAQSRELHTSLRAVPPGSVLYFELRHWKHAQKRFSTAAWTYVPMDALVDFGAVACRVREGPMRLPLYKKPVDVSLVRTKRMGGGTNELVLSLAGMGQETGQGS